MDRASDTGKFRKRSSGGANGDQGTNRRLIWVPALFLFARLIVFLSLPVESVKSYGDFWNFYYLAGLGRPFFDFWVEFPPLFPLISRCIYLLVGGREHAYIYLSAIFFSIVQTGSVYLFQRIAVLIWGEDSGREKTVLYAFMIVGLFYGWSYFDCLAVFLTLLGLFLLVRSQTIASGLILGLGGLVKWFPILVLPAAWKWLGARKAIKVMKGALLMILVIWGGLLLFSPTMAGASLISQGAKGSWESVWAILDSNFGTGNFSPDVNRLDPTTANLPTGNPALLSPWLTLLIFAGLGLYIFWKSEVNTQLQLIAFSGLTLILFFLWSPGYSPQWVLYLIPLVLLSFRGSRGVLAGAVILLINLLEWPLLLSRGMFHYLPYLIVLRTAIYVITAALFAGLVLKKKLPKENRK